MSDIKSFDTKRGNAKFEDNEISFSESTIGYYKSLYREYWKSDSTKFKIIFLLVVLSFPSAFYAILTLLNHHYGYEIVLTIFASLILMFAVQYSKGFRSPDKIELDSIEDVSYTRGKTPITRPRFVIEYTENGNTYKRRVNMPSLYMKSGEETFNRAKEAFRQQGLI
jgi:hypothetical protein